MNSYSLAWVKTLCQYTKQKYCYILPQNWLSLNFKGSTLVLTTFPIFFLIGLHFLVKLAQAGTAWRLLWCPDPAVGEIHTCSMLCMPTPTVTPVHGHHNRITKQTCLTLPFVWLRNVFGCFSFDTGSRVAQDSLTFPLLPLPSLSCAATTGKALRHLSYLGCSLFPWAEAVLSLSLPSSLSTQAHGCLLWHSSFSLVPIKNPLSGIIFLQLDIDLRLP